MRTKKGGNGTDEAESQHLEVSILTTTRADTKLLQWQHWSNEFK